MPTALIADDEPNLAAELAERLTRFWPELTIVGMPRNGIEALAQINATQPDFAFLDIRMPGLDGLKVAGLATGTRVIFVTAYDEYAVEAFDASAVDYLLKPLSDERLLRCITRLQREAPAPAPVVLPQLAKDSGPIRWLTVGLGDTTHLVAVDDVAFFQATDKYTEVVVGDKRHLIRTPLKDLALRLDPERFVQVHRGVIVSLAAIEHVQRDLLGRLRIHLRNRSDTLPVSRAYAGLFKQM
ncbi:LytR/AlgR family response regulator transcription factor [Silvimonas amylolytica]|uniref:DNA-binding response regulator n=1 Tax=Silvimonas amylolytica TaxID=449663 RepID=A0ABQ2PNJ0_9NEIS|nr:LytTR family DNA-binding domain-containing protein [Silvimonas amylolytica]GGP26888.1 DNA-binding response regulator [Silvimonas amylolytica]